MNLYLVYLSMAFTWIGDAAVTDENQSGTLPDAKNEALELIFDTKTRNIYFLRDDIDRDTIQLETNHKFFYACPKFREWHSKMIGRLEQPCLFPKLIADRRERVECEQQVIPYVTGYSDDYDFKYPKNDSSSLCRRDGKNGVQHDVYYEVFVGKEVYLGRKVGNADYTSDTLKKVPHSWALTKTIVLYSACFYEKTRETTWATYDITSFTSTARQFPTRFTTTFSQSGKTDVFELNEAPDLYKKENQIEAIPFINSPWNTEGDYIVEQTLVSPDDLPEDLEKASTSHYVDVAPQWKSLRDDWIALNAFVKKQSIRISRKSIAERKPQQSGQYSSAFAYTRFTIFCGVHGRLEHIDLENGADKLDGNEAIEKYQKLSRLESRSHGISLSVPVFWWMYIRISFNTGILLLMPNYPKTVPIPDSIRLFCDDICHRHGWAAVKERNANVLCCKATYEIMGKLFSPGMMTVPEKILSLDAEE